jgi:hypothetical protein
MRRGEEIQTLVYPQVFSLSVYYQALKEPSAKAQGNALCNKTQPQIASTTYVAKFF